MPRRAALDQRPDLLARPGEGRQFVRQFAQRLAHRVGDMLGQQLRRGLRRRVEQPRAIGQFDQRARAVLEQLHRFQRQRAVYQRHPGGLEALRDLTAQARIVGHLDVLMVQPAELLGVELRRRAADMAQGAGFGNLGPC
jgi:hypothetical protein